MSDPENFSCVRYEVSDGIATIRLSRPEHKNAMTMQMCLELSVAFDLSDADDSVGAVVVTGEDQVFCAGADLDEGFVARGHQPAGAEDYLRSIGTIGGVPRDGGGFLSLRIAASLKPVIGAISGPAVGIGATLTLPMDIRVAGEGTRFGFLFARRGLVPEAASSWFLPRLVGISRAMEWIATGRMVSADEAIAAGLVNHVVPDAEVTDLARELAREIVDNCSPVAVSAARHMLWGMLEEPSPWAAHRLDSKAIYELAAGEDLQEGVRAFFERRAPRFPSSVPRDFPDYVKRWPRRSEEMS